MKGADTYGMICTRPADGDLTLPHAQCRHLRLFESLFCGMKEQIAPDLSAFLTKLSGEKNLRCSFAALCTLVREDTGFVFTVSLFQPRPRGRTRSLFSLLVWLPTRFVARNRSAAARGG